MAVVIELWLHACMHFKLMSHLCSSPNAMSACWYLPASSWGVSSSLLLLMVSELLSEHSCWSRLCLPMILIQIQSTTTATTHCQRCNRPNEDTVTTQR